ARAEAKREDWINRISERSSVGPNVFVGPIAAGEKVLASRRSALFQFIQDNFGDALAIEMEGSGFLEAAHANQAVRALVVRGITDLIDHKGAAEASGSQRQSALNASAFAFEILAKLRAPKSARGAVDESPSHKQPLDAGHSTLTTRQLSGRIEN